MKIVFHRFNLGDVDVDVYIAEHIYKWQQTEHGQWVMQHAHDIGYQTQIDSDRWGYDVAVYGSINDDAALTEYHLRWS
jgi:hypothetical protein